MLMPDSPCFDHDPLMHFSAAAMHVYFYLLRALVGGSDG
jgi:hypothetical protein